MVAGLPPEVDSVSPELARLIRFAVARRKRQGDPGPVYLDDVADLMDYELTDGQLAVICRCEPGPRITSYYGSLCWSSELRRRLYLELAELENGDCPSPAGDVAYLDLGAWPTEPAEWFLKAEKVCRYRPAVPLKKLFTVVS